MYVLWASYMLSARDGGKRPTALGARTHAYYFDHVTATLNHVIYPGQSPPLFGVPQAWNIKVNDWNRGKDLPKKCLNLTKKIR